MFQPDPLASAQPRGRRATGRENAHILRMLCTGQGVKQAAGSWNECKASRSGRGASMQEGSIGKVRVIPPLPRAG